MGSIGPIMLIATAPSGKNLQGVHTEIIRNWSLQASKELPERPTKIFDTKTLNFYIKIN